MRREFTGQAGSVPLILLLFVKQYQMVHVELVARSGQARAPAAVPVLPLPALYAQRTPSSINPY